MSDQSTEQPDAAGELLPCANCGRPRGEHRDCYPFFCPTKFRKTITTTHGEEEYSTFLAPQLVPQPVQPSEPASDGAKCHWILWFEDQDCPPMHFTNRTIAVGAYQQHSVGYNCHLFERISVQPSEWATPLQDYDSLKDQEPTPASESAREAAETLFRRLARLTPIAAFDEEVQAEIQRAITAALSAQSREVAELREERDEARRLHGLLHAVLCPTHTHTLLRHEHSCSLDAIDQLRADLAATQEETATLRIDLALEITKAAAERAKREAAEAKFQRVIQPTVDEGSLGGLKIEYSEHDNRFYAYERGMTVWSGEATFNVWRVVRAERERKDLRQKLAALEAEKAKNFKCTIEVESAVSDRLKEQLAAVTRERDALSKQLEERLK